MPKLIRAIPDTPEDWASVLEWFETPNKKNIFVLGCFARYLTLYSQQVRALNLIAALLKHKRISPGDQIAIVGAGAAGLTAACGAAHHAVDAWVFEETDGPLHVQAHSTKRWVHPHIYDWPVRKGSDDEAGLPVMNWRADYSHKVAEQLNEQFEAAFLKGYIEKHWPVRNVKFSFEEQNDKWGLTWSEGKVRTKAFKALILAVGFGAERKTDGQRGYWDDDDLDSAFTPKDKSDKWLISGMGDGALTDLMRICIKDFRHHEIATLFATATGYLDIHNKILEMHGETGPRENDILSERFDDLTTGGLQEVLGKRLRANRPEIELSCKSRHIYGRNASILNRLMTKVLADLGCFSLTGPSKSISYTGDSYAVTFEDGSEEHYARVIRRHGPVSRLESDSSLKTIWTNCRGLRQEWINLSIQDDGTRQRLWGDFFGKPPDRNAELQSGLRLRDGATERPGPGSAQAKETNSENAAFEAAVQSFGVSARSMNVLKEIQPDGSSTMTYEIEDLRVVKSQLSALCFSFKSVVGSIGFPRLDPWMDSAGYRWDPDEHPLSPYPKEKFNSPSEEELQKRKRFCRVLRFPKPLNAESDPLTLRFTIPVLNGDALTAWEFDQMYSWDEREHMDGEQLPFAIEYFARYVSFPIETLRLSIALPVYLAWPPVPRHFVLKSGTSGLERSVIRDGILYLFPPRDANTTGQVEWTRISTYNVQDLGTLSNPAAQRWDLCVTRPQVGSCYTLDWLLPTQLGSPEFLRLEREARQIRSLLLQHGRERSENRSSNDPDLTFRFREMAKTIRKQYELLDEERFEVTIMTYSEDLRSMLPVEGVINGKEPPPEFWKFRLPIGLGLAGACYKQGDCAFWYKYSRDTLTPDFGPEYYIQLPDAPSHKYLISVPLDHPEFTQEPKAERSRQCVGVITIGSSSTESRLNEAMNESNIGKIVEICQDFCDETFDSLKDQITTNG